MGDANHERCRPSLTQRIAIELDRLDQEVGVIQYVLEDAGLSGADEIVRRLRYLATRAHRLADRVEKGGKMGTAT